HHPQQGIDHFAYEAHRIGAGGSAAVQGADAVPVTAQYGLDGGDPVARLAPVEAIAQGVDEIALHAQVGEVSLYHSVPSGSGLAKPESGRAARSAQKKIRNQKPGNEDGDVGGDHRGHGRPAHPFGAMGARVTVIAAEHGDDDAEYEGFEDADEHVPIGVEKADAVEKRLRREILEKGDDGQGAEDGDEGREDGEHGKHDHARQQARRHQEPERVERQYLHGVQLFGDRHGAQFRRHGGPHAAGNHQGGQHRADLQHDRLAYSGAHVAQRHIVGEIVGGLPGGHGPREYGRETDQGNRGDPDQVHLIDREMDVLEHGGNGQEHFRAEAQEFGHGPALAEKNLSQPDHPPVYPNPKSHPESPQRVSTLSYKSSRYLRWPSDMSRLVASLRASRKRRSSLVSSAALSAPEIPAGFPRPVSAWRFSLSPLSCMALEASRRRVWNRSCRRRISSGVIRPVLRSSSRRRASSARLRSFCAGPPSSPRLSARDSRPSPSSPWLLARDPNPCPPEPGEDPSPPDRPGPSL